MNQSIAAGGARHPGVVLRQPYWAVTEFVLGAALAVTHLLATSSGSFWGDVTGGGAIGSLVAAFSMIVFQYKFEPGRITVRNLYYGRRSADLTRLTSVTAPPRRGNFLRRLFIGRFLVLQDEQGSVVRLNFYGTPSAQRRRMLAALEPYLMAEGVSRTGLVTEALSGELW